MGYIQSSTVYILGHTLLGKDNMSSGIIQLLL